MSPKRTFFSQKDRPEADSGLPENGGLYTGQPDFGAAQEGPSPQYQAKKGHAAYTAQDEMPPYTPRGGKLDGLLGDMPQQDLAGERGGEGGLLSVITDDALAGECTKRICPSCPVKKEADDARLRALAEVENTRKRLERERTEQARFAAEKVLADILPSLDNLDLALQHGGANEACKDFVIGVRMTRKLLLEALAKHGLVQVGEVGEEFDPARHEAVGMVKSPDVPDGHVCALLSSGYMLHDRLLRPAKVTVCKK